ncbi:thiamine ABC transporter ATP-binding protein, partial [Enterobacter hormaechei]
LPGELSGGQPPRVAVAGCLVGNQPLLVLEVTFSGLVTPLAHEKLKLVEEFCEREQNNLSVIHI